MGEEEWRVHCAGAPSLDHLRRSNLHTREELESLLKIKFENPSILVAYHPVTIARDTVQEAAPLFEALASLPQQILFCYPNADAGSRELIARARSFAASRVNSHVFVNLDAVNYWSLLRQVEVFLGNSSSGIMETPSLLLPTVNVGLRQRGRERARNIIDAAPDAYAILDALRTAKNEAFRESLRGMTNPYGDGFASEKIVQVLTTVSLSQALLMKRHSSLPSSDSPSPSENLR
jgi:UDP-N-acetylglucosamine 2-epimerase (non-hydrolysing)/GDP/UDP-N,N'-diacetylbacillosamine 2-epimerase (hydrolysing)